MAGQLGTRLLLFVVVNVAVVLVVDVVVVVVVVLVCQLGGVFFRFFDEDWNYVNAVKVTSDQLASIVVAVAAFFGLCVNAEIPARTQKHRKTSERSIFFGHASPNLSVSSLS